MNFLYLIASPFIGPILIPFWLVTTMDVDPGISRKLPSMTEEKDVDPGISRKLPSKTEEKIKTPEINNRNIFVVLINQNNQILYGIGSATKLIEVQEINGDIILEESLRKEVKEFITNNGVDPSSSDSPDKAAVYLHNHVGTQYGIYLKVQIELTEAYNELRNEKSREDYGKDFIKLDANQKSIVKKYYPMKIFEAEIVEE